METSAFGVVHKAYSKETKQRKKNAEKTALAGFATATAGGLTGTGLGVKARNKASDAGLHGLKQVLNHNSAVLTRGTAELHAKTGKISEARDLGRKYGAALDSAERHKNAATIATKKAKKLTKGSLAATGVGATGLVALDRANKISEKPKTAGKFGFGKR